ncbi:MAG TPA: hypothetical protein VKT73_12795 [Xanthobacteraceae bacterium]|nr:hypothetical protein [Xanthobacteraceae bacterium]
MPTPLKIEIGMFYRITEGGDKDYRDGDLKLPAVRDAINEFVALGLLKKTPDVTRLYQPTAGMTMWINALCEVPYPERHWVMPERQP